MLSLPRVRVQSLVGQLRPHRPPCNQHGAAKETNKQTKKTKKHTLQRGGFAGQHRKGESIQTWEGPPGGCELPLGCGVWTQTGCACMGLTQRGIRHATGLWGRPSVTNALPLRFSRHPRIKGKGSRGAGK